MYEDNLAPSRENDVWRSGQVAPVKAVSVSQRV
jgi:hypothetical protein